MLTTQLSRRDFARIVAGGALAGIAAEKAGAGEALAGSDDFAFGVITDAQYCDAESSGTRHYKASAQKLTECVNALNQLDLAFVIHLGDFIDRDASSYDVMNPIYRRLAAPRYHVLGNHDFSVDADKLDDVATMLGMKDRYYHFCHQGWRFVVLDGNDLSLFARPKDSPEYEQALSLYTTLRERNAPNAQTWNGALSEAQLVWLDRQLSEADEADERVVAFCHFPIYPEDVHNLWNDTAVVRILESHRSAVAFLNGHNHAGNYGEKGGIHYLTFPGMVETQDTTAYAVVHVQSDSLRVAGYGRTRNQLLKIGE